MRQEASRPNRIAKLIMPGGSAQVGFENTKSLHSLLDFGAMRRRDGPAQTHSEQIAAFMNCFPEFIDLARFKLNGFMANAADWEILQLRGSHGTASKSESPDCTRDRSPGMGFDPRDV
jgi:hypothetical protein